MHNKTFPFFLLLVLLLTLSCRKDKKPIACLPQSLQNGLIAFYPFSNGRLTDPVNGLTLINSTTASPTSDRLGNPKCAFKFTNSPTGNEFLMRTSPTVLNNITQFSISLWYQPLDTVFDNRYQFESLISRDTTPLTCPNKLGQWSVALFDCRRAVFSFNRFSLWDDQLGKTGIDKCEKSFAEYTGKWHHLVVVFNNGVMKLYRNGVETTEKYDRGSGSSCGTMSQNIGNLFVGKFFTGKIDDIAFFNREITPTEVNQLFKTPACCD
jgi:hypothetical protein